MLTNHDPRKRVHVLFVSRRMIHSITSPLNILSLFDVNCSSRVAFGTTLALIHTSPIAKYRVCGIAYFSTGGIVRNKSHFDNDSAFLVFASGESCIGPTF